MSSTSDKRSRGVRVLGLAFAALFVLLAIAGLIAYLGFHGTPQHWQQEQARLAGLSAEQLNASSESFRNEFMTQWGNPGDKTPTTEADLFGQRQDIRVPFDDLNTWIKAEGSKLLQEIDKRLPNVAPSAMVDTPGDGLLRFSFEVMVKKKPQIITMSFDMSIAQDGALISTLKQATAGKLPLPVDTAISLVASKTDEKLVLDLMQGNPIPPLELPIDPSEDGLRDGRIIGLKVTDEAVIITRETVRRKKK